MEGTGDDARLARLAMAVAWVAACIATALAAQNALDGTADRAVIAWSVAGWSVTGLGLVAVLVPSVVGLVVIRLATSLAVPGASLAALHGDSAAIGATAIGLAAVALLVSLSAPVGEAFVQASAYGAERRLLLRPPVAALLPLGVGWVLSSAGLLGGVWMIATGRWLGAAAVAVGLGVGWLVAALGHRLARRWLVVVPSGVVVHDHLALAETLMMTVPNIAGAGLALVGSEAADLTGPAAGHAIEVTVREHVTVLLPANRDHPSGRAIHAAALLIAPSRPGRALQAMADRRVPIGATGG